jgi:hypothetical protein
LPVDPAGQYLPPVAYGTCDDINEVCGTGVGMICDSDSDCGFVGEAQNCQAKPDPKAPVAFSV